MWGFIMVANQDLTPVRWDIKNFGNQQQKNFRQDITLGVNEHKEKLSED